MIIVFFGSSKFSIAALRACQESSHDVALVISTPDQKQGRGQHYLPTCVKEYAQENHIPCLTPETLKDAKELKQIKNLRPDLFVVSSYGKLIPNDWLKIPSKKALNVHPSLLPRHRGAAPIQWTVLNGDKKTGVSIAEVTAKLDSGDIYAQKVLEVPAGMDAEQLHDVLAALSAELLVKVFNDIETGQLCGKPQEESKSSYARKMTKADGYVTWEQPADVIVQKILGLKPWPQAYVMYQGQPLILVQAESCEGVSQSPAGTIDLIEGEFVTVCTAEGKLRLIQVKPAGKKVMSAAEFIHGRRLKKGDLLPAS